MEDSSLHSILWTVAGSPLRYRFAKARMTNS